MTFPLLVVVSGAIAVATAAGCLLLAERRRLAMAAGVLGAGAITLVHGLGYFRLTADDAYITFRYARNLADGLGPNWNSDGRVEGYTSFLWMMIISGTEKLDTSPVIATQVLGFCLIIATFAIVYRVWLLWSAEETGGGHWPSAATRRGRARALAGGRLLVLGLLRHGDPAVHGTDRRGRLPLPAGAAR
jgi:hypothetical protein